MPKNWRWETRQCQEANESIGNEEEEISFIEKKYGINKRYKRT